MTKAQNWIRHNIKGDPIIWSITFVLAIFGLIVVYSASSIYAGVNSNKVLFKQGFFIAFGLVLVWAFHNINYKHYSRLSRIALLLAVVLLILTYTFGVSVNDAQRWLRIGGFTFQTSDFAKLALISNLASMLAKRQNNIDDASKTLYPILIWSGLICGLIALADLSSALQLFATCVIIFFIGRVPLKQLFMLMIIGLTMVFMFLLIGQRWPTAKARFSRFWDTATGVAQVHDMEPQVRQSYVAIANGGFTGNGLGHDETDDTVFLGFSDYIYAKINNDLGSLFGIPLIFLYLALLYRGMKVAAKSDQAFGGLLSAGLSFMLVIQALMHMAVNVGLTPATGIPLPFLSLGGTSILFTSMTVGIILSVSRGDRKEENTEQIVSGNVATEQEA